MTQRIGVMLLLLVIYGATVTGHQLMPVPALVAVTALVLFAGLELRTFPAIMAVMLVAWVAYMTTTWLQGHFGTITQPLGSLGQNVNQNLTARLGGSSEHVFVVDLRLVLTATIWALAAAGFVRGLLQRRADVAMALLGATPFLLPVLQPYGGEMLLRVFLFVLPQRRSSWLVSSSRRRTPAARGARPPRSPWLPAC